MHCLFLHFLEAYPELKEKAKKELVEFISNPAARHINVRSHDLMLVTCTTCSMFLIWACIWSIFPLLIRVGMSSWNLLCMKVWIETWDISLKSIPNLILLILTQSRSHQVYMSTHVCHVIIYLYSVDANRIAKSFAGYNVTGMKFVMMQLTFNRYVKVVIFVVDQFSRISLPNCCPWNLILTWPVNAPICAKINPHKIC